MKASGIVLLPKPREREGTSGIKHFPHVHCLRGDFVGEFRCHRRWGQTTMPLLSEKPIFVIHSPLGDIQKLGNTPYGERRIISILGGTVEGPKLKGKVLSGGADWQIVRADGVVHLQARYTIETETGGQILVDAEGYRRGPP